MNWKEIAEKELKEIRELADYISDDSEATQQLNKILEKVQVALSEIKQIGDIQ